MPVVPAVSARHQVERLTASHGAAVIAEVEILMTENQSLFEINEELSRPHARVWIAKREGRLEGAMLAWFAADELHVLQVVTEERCRRQGVASLLLRTALAEARSRGSRLAVLEVRGSNSAAISLYKRFGFEKVRVRDAYYENPSEPAWEMTLDLTPKKEFKELTLKARTRHGSAYHVLTFEDPAGSFASPGQFAMVRGADWGDAPLLARPMSYLSGGHEPSILIKVIGKGSLHMAHAEPGTRFTLLGPLGTSWRAPNPEREVVLVAGGVGIAPLLFFAQTLTPKGFRVTSVYGARSADDLPLLEELRSLSEVIVTTEDGSVGQKGRVTDVLPKVFSRKPQVYTCGPDRMMAKVAEMCESEGLPCEVSLETPMACGYGVCLGCPVPKKAGGYLYACVEGPCIDAGLIDFAQGEHAPGERR